MVTANMTQKRPGQLTASLRRLVGRPADSWAAFTPPFFFLATFLFESAQAGYSRASDTISELALRPFGWVENILFCLMGLALLLIAARLHHALKGTGFRLDAALLALAGLAFLVIAACPTAPGGKALDLPSTIHLAAAALVAAISPLVCLVMGWNLRNSNRHQLMARCLLGAGVCGLALGAACCLALVLDTSWLGGIERAVTLNGLVGIEMIVALLAEEHGLALPRLANHLPSSHGLFSTPRLAHVHIWAPRDRWGR